MLGWHVYSGIDLKIPTRLPRVAIYITSPNLLTCCCSNSRETTCLDYPGNPQTKKNPLLLIQTRVSTRKERNGLKMSASATSVAHPSVPHLSGREWAFFSPSHHICACNFPNPTPPSPDSTLLGRQTDSSTSWRKDQEETYSLLFHSCCKHFTTSV